MLGYEQIEFLKMAVPGANVAGKRVRCCIHALMLPY